MVSTDGSALTPDEPEENDATPHSGDDRQRQNSNDNPNDNPSETATSDSNGESTNGSTNGSVNGSTVTKTGKRKKQAKEPRKRTRIDRLVMEFQPDAVEMEHRKVAGGLRWTLYTAVLLLAAVVTWASWAKVDRLVVADGKIVTTGTPVLIQAAVTSPIRAIHVKFGETVRSGDILVTLDPTFSDADVAKLETQVNGLLAKLTRLIAEQNKNELDISEHANDPIWQTELQVLIDRRNEYEAKIEEFAAEKRQLEAQRNKNKGEVADLTERVSIREKLYQTVKSLAEKGVAPDTELLDNQIQLSFVKKELNTAKNQLIETEAELDALEKRQISYMAANQAKISLERAETHQGYVAAMEDLKKARRSKELSRLYVPDDMGHEEFVVVEVAERSVGSVVQPGEPLIRLVPAGQVEYEAEIKVDGKDVASIRPDDTVRIKLTAFPYMKFGTLEGEVRKINEDATEEGQPPMTRTYYKTRVRITQDNLIKEKLPENYRLIPGMSVTAEIKIGRRRVIDYFLYPLFRSLDTSIREP